MNLGETVFSQIMKHVPRYEFNKCVSHYKGDLRVKTFSCWDQFLCMAFAQLSYRESLRDIECCLRAMQERLYHMGIKGHVSRNTLARANEKRSWQIYADFGQILIHIARNLYIKDPFGLELDQTIYALDATTIDLCLSVFPWAKFRKSKGGIKLHTLLDLRGPLPVIVSITNAKVHEVNILDELAPEVGSIYILDRGYLDFSRLYRFAQNSAFFIIRAKSNLQYRRLYSHQIDKTTNVISDQTIMLSNFYVSKDYPEKLRRIRYFDSVHQKFLIFLTNNFSLPAQTISDLYRCRWQVELFFKWIKQHLRIKKFYGTSENAVKTQIWIAISVYVLVAIIKKRLHLRQSLYTILQVLSVTLFEKMPIQSVFDDNAYTSSNPDISNQLNLFDF